MSDSQDWIEEAIANRNRQYFMAEELKDLLEEHGVEVDGDDVANFVCYWPVGLEMGLPLDSVLAEWAERFGDAELTDRELFNIAFRALVEYRLGHTVRL